jgi:hypothetical protein
MVNVRQADRSYKLEHEYHYTDHQGNLRLAFRVKDQTLRYDLTAETDKQSDEERHFTNYTESCRTTEVKHSGDYSVKLHTARGGTSRIYKTIAMAAGETLTMQVWAKADPVFSSGRSPLPPKGVSPQTPEGGLLRILRNSPLGLGALQFGEQKSPQLQLNLFGLVPLVKKLFSPRVAHPMAAAPITHRGSTLHAGLAFTQDQNGTLPATGLAVVEADIEGWQLLTLRHTAHQSGELTVEIFNYTYDPNTGHSPAVYFDDWQIEITKPATTEIVQEVHYDPWGRLFRIYLIFPPAFVLGWGRFSVVFEFFFLDFF